MPRKFDKVKLQTLLEANATYTVICSELGISKSTASYHANKLNLAKGQHQCKADWSIVQEDLDNGTGRKAILSKYKIASDTFTKAVSNGAITYVLQKDEFSLDRVLVENSSYNRGNIKRRLLALGILKNECVECGQGPEWQGKPLVMVLDHINGVNNDNRIENLRMLCPNCNSQTETFAGRNRKPK